MKKKFRKLLQNKTFQAFMFGVLAYVAFSAMVIAVLNVPSDAILDSGLQEIIKVFED